jgi:2-methylcitrate dehydratase PrpD
MKNEMMSGENPVALSALIAGHLARSDFEKIPGTAVTAAKRAILDGLGVMLAASGCSDDIQPFVELARAYRGLPQASIFGFGDRVGLPMAALANGAMAHALDFEDAFDPVPTHPNASLLPAVFAVAEARGPVHGRDFIAAVTMGCDLVCRMALSLRQPMESGGWYPPPILGAFGATAAAARLLGLTPAQITSAFSLLLCQNSCPGEIKYSPDTVIRAIREAFPAHAAVLSCLLAERGVRGFEHPLEGPSGFFSLFAAGKYDPADLLDRWGERFWIEQLSFKKWPSCRATHSYIEAAQQLRALHDFSAGQIALVMIHGNEMQRMLCEPDAQRRAPQTIIDAKFSLPFTLAAALLHEEVTLDSFTPSTLRDPRLLELAAKIRFQPAGGGLRQRAAAGGLSILLRDGQELHLGVRDALGDPNRPLDDAALRGKFIDCAARAARPLPRVAAERLADRIFALELETDVGAILNGMYD